MNEPHSQKTGGIYHRPIDEPTHSHSKDWGIYHRPMNEPTLFPFKNHFPMNEQPIPFKRLGIYHQAITIPFPFDWEPNPMNEPTHSHSKDWECIPPSDRRTNPFPKKTGEYIPPSIHSHSKDWGYIPPSDRQTNPFPFKRLLGIYHRRYAPCIPPSERTNPFPFKDWDERTNPFPFNGRGIYHRRWTNQPIPFTYIPPSDEPTPGDSDEQTGDRPIPTPIQKTTDEPTHSHSKTGGVYHRPSMYNEPTIPIHGQPFPFKDWGYIPPSDRRTNPFPFKRLTSSDIPTTEIKRLRDREVYPTNQPIQKTGEYPFKKTGEYIPPSDRRTNPFPFKRLGGIPPSINEPTHSHSKTGSIYHRPIDEPTHSPGGVYPPSDNEQPHSHSKDWEYIPPSDRRTNSKDWEYIPPSDRRIQKTGEYIPPSERRTNPFIQKTGYIPPSDRRTNPFHSKRRIPPSDRRTNPFHSKTGSIPPSDTNQPIPFWRNISHRTDNEPTHSHSKDWNIYHRPIDEPYSHSSEYIPPSDRRTNPFIQKDWGVYTTVRLDEQPIPIPY
ncbi:unnamed protein product [Acanthosepion pharaonis]|uniref:Uncharacterized protein n=1 Tax=Acanthosepion pharaonis TaxID=158019 RepID=A0A812AW88_ACAPH|nr:unnamed protein product [Sepia pharaonis]